MVTALILRGSDVALFEEGNYCPRLTPEIIERLLTDTGPQRFAIKSVPIGEGQRSLVVTGLATSLSVDTPRSRTARNPQLLAVTRAMLERIMVLTPYARHTRRLSSEALKVRQVLSTATDPDELVFNDLPRALGLDPIPAAAPNNKKTADSYVARLTRALNDISDASAVLRQDVVTAIGQAFGISGHLGQLRASLTEALGGFANASLEIDLQGFVSRVLNTSLPDEDWLDPIIIRLTNKALGDWTDQDIENFPLRVKEMARRLDRVSHLYQAQEAPASQPQTVEPKKIDTHLLTLTTPQGTEARTLIHVPKQSRDAAKALAVSVIGQAEQQLGPGGARILLAALAEQLAATDHDPLEEEKL
jgi:hypothetical protein